MKNNIDESFFQPEIQESKVKDRLTTNFPSNFCQHYQSLVYGKQLKIPRVMVTFSLLIPIFLELIEVVLLLSHCCLAIT